MLLNGKREKFFLFLVCLILGTMISTQFRSAENARHNTLNQQRAEDLAEKLQNTEKENKVLTERLEKLEAQGSGTDAKVLQSLKLNARGANAKTLGNPHSLDLITEKLLKLVNG